MQRIQRCLRAQIALPIVHREDETAIAIEGVEFFEDRNCLLGERHKVAFVVLDLHSVPGDCPHALFEVDLIPRRAEQLVDPDEGEGEKFKRCACHRVSAVAIDIAQKRWQLVLAYGRMRFAPVRNESAAEVRRDVALGAARRDRIAKDLSADHADPMRHFGSAPSFDLPQSLEQFRRLDFADRRAPIAGNMSF